jgi:hypothetical protein
VLAVRLDNYRHHFAREIKWYLIKFLELFHEHAFMVEDGSIEQVL